MGETSYPRINKQLLGFVTYYLGSLHHHSSCFFQVILVRYQDLNRDDTYSCASVRPVATGF
ncbi:hypothetical protein K445DRAFT_314901 [Daldinia sp. EC12]|nr:hypothetical protein K445DRAFT_314901 [Daldinia sp. EC12]